MPYINFSDDDLYRANTADLVSFLQSHGEQVKKVGSTYKYIYTDGSGTHDSVTIHGGKWYDHKNQHGGYAVKFLQEFLGFSFQDSVIELLGGHCSAQTVRSVPRESPKPIVKPFELPEANSDMRIEIPAWLYELLLIEAAQTDSAVEEIAESAFRKLIERNRNNVD